MAMESISINDFIVKTYDCGHSILAVKGEQRRTYTKEYLTKCWLTMSNDSFYNAFGFNWVPPIDLQNEVRKTLDKGVQGTSHSGQTGLHMDIARAARGGGLWGTIGNNSLRT